MKTSTVSTNQYISSFSHMPPSLPHIRHACSLLLLQNGAVDIFTHPVGRIKDTVKALDRGTRICRARTWVVRFTMFAWGAIRAGIMFTALHALGRQNTSEMMTIGGGVGSFNRRRVTEVTILCGGGDKREDKQGE